MTTEALEAAIALHFSQKARAAYEWQLKYNAYITSPAWQHKRLQKLLSLVGITAQSYEAIDWLAQQASRYLYRCEKCGSQGTQAELRVEHRHYRNLGKETLADLVVLCGFCHQALHEVVRTTGLPLEVVAAHAVTPRRAPAGNEAARGATTVAAFVNHPPLHPPARATLRAPSTDV